jgi:DNA-binding response OmpR family regulator
LKNWGYEVLVTTNGEEAWAALQRSDAPSLAILDIMMPEIEGREICRRLREMDHAIPPYVILLTAKHGTREIVEGIEAGADDYLTKPYDREELRVRVQVGVRIVELQTKLTERVAELEHAIEHVKQLQGILPICSYCKKIRADQDYWQTVENYVVEHSDAQFSHGICPDCYETTVKVQLDSFRANAKAKIEAAESLIPSPLTEPIPEIPPPISHPVQSRGN